MVGLGTYWLSLGVCWVPVNCYLKVFQTGSGPKVGVWCTPNATFSKLVFSVDTAFKRSGPKVGVWFTPNAIFLKLTFPVDTDFTGSGPKVGVWYTPNATFSKLFVVC